MAQETIGNINKISNRFNDGAAPIFSMRVDGVSQNLQDTATNNASSHALDANAESNKYNGGFNEVANHIFDVNTLSQLGLMMRHSGLTSIGFEKQHDIKSKSEKDDEISRDAMRSAEKAIRQAYEQVHQEAIQLFNEADPVFNTAISEIDQAINNITPKVDKIKDSTQTISLNGRTYAVDENTGQYIYHDKDRNPIIETDEDTINTIKSKHAEIKTNGGQLRNDAEQHQVLLLNYLILNKPKVEHNKENHEQRKKDFDNGKYKDDPKAGKAAVEEGQKELEETKLIVRNAQQVNQEYTINLKKDATAILKEANEKVAAAPKEKVVEQVEATHANNAQLSDQGFTKPSFDLSAGSFPDSPFSISASETVIGEKGKLKGDFKVAHDNTASEPKEIAQNSDINLNSKTDMSMST